MSSQPLWYDRDSILPAPGLLAANQPIRVALSPLATVTTLAFESVGRERGSPADWPQAVRAELDPADLALLAEVAMSRLIPDAVLPLPDVYVPSFEDELERVAVTPPEAITAEIWDAGLVDAEWSTAARSPRRWLRAYVTAMERAWIGAKPLWDRATALLERETERVGAALAKGALDVLFHRLHPRTWVQDHRLFMDYHGGVEARIAPGMVIVPIVAGSQSGYIGHNHDFEVFDLCYPLPGVRRLCTGNGGPASASGSNGVSLDALVGEPRAAILRRLDVGLNGRSLATLLQLAPSAIAHHLDALERAGLVYRVRQGRSVMVHRSGRGNALVALYE